MEALSQYPASWRHRMSSKATNDLGMVHCQNISVDRRTSVRIVLRHLRTDVLIVINPVLTVAFQLLLIGSATVVIAGMIREYRGNIRTAVRSQAGFAASPGAASSARQDSSVAAAPGARRVGSRKPTARATALNAAARAPRPPWGASAPRSARRSGLRV